MADTFLEPAVPLSQSVIWDIQRRYFEHAGQDAWSRGTVPHYVTTNAHVARAYARVIAAWAEDLRASEQGLPDGPLRVVELGAGSGRLGFLLAHELDQLTRDRELPRFQVVLTDFTDANVDAWLEHPDLQEAFADGRLDCARFDADHPAPLQLRHGGQTLDDLGGPVAIAANYVVDTLRQDAFAIQDGLVHEVLVRACLPEDAERDADDPEVSREVLVRTERRRARAPYHHDPAVNDLIERYRRSIDQAEILIPVGMMGAVRFLRGCSDGRVCLLMGDKGYRAPRDMEKRRLGQLVKHGSFSVMANLDAVAHDLGGTTLTHGNRYTRFTVVAAATGGGALHRFRGAYRDEIDTFGPAEYHRGYKLVRKAIEGEDGTRQLSLPIVLLLLRVSNYDPVVFARWGEDLLAQAGEANGAIQHDLALCLEQVLLRTCQVSRKDDVRFVAGRILFRIERYVEAAEQFRRVAEAMPKRRTAWFNLGLSEERQGRRAAAREAYQKALEVDPDYERAAESLKRVR